LLRRYVEVDTWSLLSVLQPLHREEGDVLHCWLRECQRQRSATPLQWLDGPRGGSVKRSVKRSVAVSILRFNVHSLPLALTEDSSCAIAIVGAQKVRFRYFKLYRRLLHKKGSWLPLYSRIPPALTAALLENKGLTRLDPALVI
jgi:hypothetical protein